MDLEFSEASLSVRPAYSVFFNPRATYDDGSCPPVIHGCNDPASITYRDDSVVTHSMASLCEYEYKGCMDSIARNFDPSANVGGRCEYHKYGCTDEFAANYDPEFTAEDPKVPCWYLGCTDERATNYNPSADLEDGSCHAVFPGCTDPSALNFFAAYNWNDGTCSRAGCTDETDDNYDGAATFNVPSMCAARRRNRQLSSHTGCMDPQASNYDESAVQHSNSACQYCILGCRNTTALNYNPQATCNATDTTTEYDPYTAPVCEFAIHGCTMENGTLNYNPLANVYAECIFVVSGCMDPAASNYNNISNVDSGECTYDRYGCTNPVALTYDPNATLHNASACIMPVAGCTDATAYNFDARASVMCGDNCCSFHAPGCMFVSAANFDPLATVDDGTCVLESPPPSPPPPAWPPSPPPPSPPPPNPPSPSTPPPPLHPPSPLPSPPPPSPANDQQGVMTNIIILAVCASIITACLIENMRLRMRWRWERAKQASVEMPTSEQATNGSRSTVSGGRAVALPAIDNAVDTRYHLPPSGRLEQKSS